MTASSATGSSWCQTSSAARKSTTREWGCTAPFGQYGAREPFPCRFRLTGFAVNRQQRTSRERYTCQVGVEPSALEDTAVHLRSISVGVSGIIERLYSRWCVVATVCPPSSLGYPPYQIVLRLCLSLALMYFGGIRGSTRRHCGRKLDLLQARLRTSHTRRPLAHPLAG